MKKGKMHIKVTSWVAIVIILAVGSTFTFLIWTNANESWVYETAYPQINRKITRAITNIETSGWRTYSDQGYGFQISHPARYSETVSTITSSSVLGVGGTSVGPLVFVKLDTASLKSLGETKFNKYWNYLEKAESPKNYCKKMVIEGYKGSDIKMVFCLIGTKEERYALISGPSFNIFVDGYTAGNNATLKSAYGTPSKTMSQNEFTQILSTFEFL